MQGGDTGATQRRSGLHMGTLAKRVPVRIAIDHVPSGVPLVSGLTATVTIRNNKYADGDTLLQRVGNDLAASFFGLIGEASARPDCIPQPH